MKNSYPLTRIEDILNQLSGANFLGVIDLMSRYYEMETAEDDIKKTSFNTKFDQWFHLIMNMMDIVQLH